MKGRTMTLSKTLPASRTLTDKQLALVEAMLGGAKTRDAIAQAGYADPSAGYRALRTEAVQEAIMRGARAALVHDVGPALGARRALLESKSEYVRLEACKDILDRAGLKAKGVTDVGASVSITIMLD